MTQIEEIYYMQKDCSVKSEKIADIGEVSAVYDKYLNIIKNVQNKAIFSELDDIYGEMCCVIEKQGYIHGFKKAVKMMSEIFAQQYEM